MKGLKMKEREKTQKKAANLPFALYCAISLAVFAAILFLPREPGLLSERGRYLAIGFSQTALIAISSMLGFYSASKFTFESTLGKAISLISAGVASWALANAIWTGYTLAGVDMPYPSIADIFYLGIIPLSLAGAFFLLKSFDVKLDKKTLLKYSVLPAIAAIPLLYFFVFDKIFEDVDPLMKLLNIAYPLGDVMFVSGAIFVFFASRSSEMFKPTAVLLAGYCAFAIADFGFVATTALGTYYTGNWVTALFTLGLATVGAGLYLFRRAVE